ncbi:MAG: transporter substrate-binding domain-containing protein [Bacteroidota bacterium]
MQARIFFALILIASCNTQKEETSPGDKMSSEQTEASVPFQKDMDDILADGKLKAITTYSSTSYFLYKGHPMGFEYELLKSFADYIGVELEIIVSNNINNLFTNLNNGRADIIAHGLAITNERKEDVLFTDYLYLTHQVLIQKKPDNWRTMNWSALEHSLINDAIELIGDTVSVRSASSFMERLQNMSEEIGGQIIIDTLPGTTTTDDAIDMVLNGEIKYTVADNSLARVFATYDPILDIDVPISFSQRIAWATRISSPLLNEAINEWLAYVKKEVLYYIIYNKYFKNNKDFRKRVKSEFYSINNQKISVYDDLIKEKASKINWDWRLLASLVYQESRFNPKADSWAGAQGLMQLMPATATELGVKDRSDPIQSLEGGSTYLSRLYGYFDSIPDNTQRIKFAMASYNCGYNHVKDARRLAPKYELDPLRWDDNVEKMILALSKSSNYNDPLVKFGYLKGIEPYNYVRQIFERYDHYTQFIQE